MKPTNTGNTENEKALRLFQDEGKEESLREVFEATCHDAPGQGLC